MTEFDLQINEILIDIDCRTFTVDTTSIMGFCRVCLNVFRNEPDIDGLCWDCYEAAVGPGADG